MMYMETDRLYLKPIDESDATFQCELLNTPKFIEYIGDRNVRSEEDAAAYIKEKMLPQFERLGYGNYVVVRKEDNAKLGTCGLFDREGLEGIDIGFAFLPQYEGKGYAYEAAFRLQEEAFSIFGLHTMCAIATVNNISSRRLIEKLGLQFIKIIKLEGDDTELMYFELRKLS
jgi:[ribosomal protein S5]-alanine N-acetyltransferase